MARFNEILVGRFNRALQKLTGIKGMASVPQLGTEVMANFEFPLGNEFRYLESWFRYRAFVTSGPVAAVTSGISLRNPANSNVVAVIEQLFFPRLSSDVASQTNINRGQATADLDTTAGLTGGSQREDPRGQSASTCVLSINSVALVTLTNPTLILMIGSGAGGGLDNSPISNPNQEILLMPGDAIQLSEQNAQNQLTRCGFCWRERFLEESERT